MYLIPVLHIRPFYQNEPPDSAAQPAHQGPACAALSSIATSSPSGPGHRKPTQTRPLAPRPTEDRDG